MADNCGITLHRLRHPATVLYRGFLSGLAFGNLVRRLEMNRNPALLARARIIRTIRDYFHAEGFIETDTPSLVLSPGMEPHIRPMKVEGNLAFLPTSPEFAMKRLLARGYPRIFQICKAYRSEPKSQTHNPEFSILEWYRANSGYEAIMDDVERLFVSISNATHGSPRFTTSAGIQDVARPWLRFTVEECFSRFAGLNLAGLLSTEALAQACVERGWANARVLATESLSQPGAWDDLFFRVMLNAIEPALAKLGRPVIIYFYPESQAALSNVVADSHGLRWAKRFEVYAGGLELGNAFDELINPREQRQRFEKDMTLRKRLYGDTFPTNPIDEDFLRDLENMPPSGGIAMGVDRLVMYFTGAKAIRDVLWLESCWD